MMNDERKIRSDAVFGSALIIHPSSFPSSHRLSGKLSFAAVYEGKRKVTRGPLVMYSLPNELGHCRMGISIGKRVGTAPRRNRIKRMLREAFRLNPVKLSRGYDLVIVVRPHVPMKLGEYQSLLSHLLQSSEKAWQKTTVVSTDSDSP